MTRLENVIEEVKNARIVYRFWIFDDNGKIKDNIFCAEVLKVLEKLKKYEIEVTDEEIDEIYNTANDAGNTYNWNANISDHINWYTKGDVTLARVHLYGDIRGSYSSGFVVRHEDYNNFIEWLLWEEIADTQSKRIGDTNMWADIEPLSESYGVYDYDTDNDVGEFYECKLENLLNAIKEKNNE